MAGSLTGVEPPGPDAGPPTVPGARNVKLLLFLSSGLTLLLLLGAMVRENFLASWQGHQRTYRAMLASSEDPAQAKLASDFPVELRQVDLPQLGTVDRCVSCHSGIDNPAMADAPQPYRQHPGDYLTHHPVEKYGCTVCHQGQGAATNFHEAKATDVFWDYPLLPNRLTQASCGSCHAADSDLMRQHAPELASGHDLFLDRGCLSCHKLDGVGGQLGPALDGEGSKIKHQLPMAHVVGDQTLANWLAQHFDDPQGIVEGSQMRPPRLTPGENEALTIYMLSLRDRDLPQSYVPSDRITALSDRINHPELDGDRLYALYCVNCHGDGTFGVWDRFFKRFVPAVRGPGLRAIADEDYVRSAIAHGRPGSLMPAWHAQAGGLSEPQIDALVTYLREGDGRPAQPLVKRETPPGDMDRGALLYIQNCAGCHASNQLAPTLTNPTFQASASDEFLADTIRNGRADTAMPAFQRDGVPSLSDQEIGDLIAFIRAMLTEPVGQDHATDASGTPENLPAQ
jgi:mono/diheme cytochrome c family protein